MNENSAAQVGGYLGVLALGAVIGAAVAMLYAPRSGKDTRDLLAQKARDLKERAGDKLDEARDLVMGKKEELRHAVSSRG